MSSLPKMLAILDLFTASRPRVAGEEIAEHMGYTRATAYRYLRELCLSGLLSRFSGAYILGPRAIELDCTIVHSDPLLKAAEPVMEAFRDRYDCNLQLLSMYDDRMVAIWHVRGNDAMPIASPRGRRMPLWRGSGAKSILSVLPAARLRRLYNLHADEANASGLGSNFKEISASLRAIRKAGFAFSMGELDDRVVAFGAPIQHAGAGLPSAITMVFTRARYAMIEQDQAIAIIKAAAARITSNLEESEYHLASWEQPPTS